MVNQLFKPLMGLMILGDTNNLRMDQVIYYVYKTDKHMKEHAPKTNNTDTFPTEGQQVTYLRKYYEVDQDSLSSVSEDEYYSYEEESCGTVGTHNKNWMAMMLFLILRIMFLTQELMMYAS